MEEYRIIKDYSNYQISNVGNVKHFDEILPEQNIFENLCDCYDIIYKNSNCSKSFRIRDKGSNRTLSIHRLVAEAFLSNLDHKKFVLHKDGNGYNNNVENLYWSKTANNISNKPNNNPLFKGSKDCPCGGKYTWGSKSTHIRTDKHKKHLKKL
ncbi:HNH endonuclease [Clostridium sp.]|uniref:HNH endonuclease n=1 Tax=Clostridium sp. TaxID=1506 RepID=UPI00284FB965|nr:HNH endonuclease [Clostridium sp.]MDR3593668.1 HNH endonuclease [Clostridium sp.]